LSESSSAN